VAFHDATAVPYIRAGLTVEVPDERVGNSIVVVRVIGPLWLDLRLYRGVLACECARSDERVVVYQTEPGAGGELSGNQTHCE